MYVKINQIQMFVGNSVGYWLKTRNDNMDLFSCLKWQMWVTFWLPNRELKQIWHMAGDENMV